jgi:hypothetical protein
MNYENCANNWCSNLKELLNKLELREQFDEKTPILTWKRVNKN